MKTENEIDLLNIVQRCIEYSEARIDLNQINLQGNIWILGAGKASVSMAEQVMHGLDVEVWDGLIISPTHEYVEPLQIFKGAHPLPDQNSVAASYELRELARSIPAGDTVIFCLSGGASALMCIPPNGIEIDELAFTYELLLKSGANIHDINIVRKHLCELKGGQLAEELSLTNLITLVASDVPGNDFETIGSAPTVPDSSTFQNAFDVLLDYNVWDKLPESIRNHIHLGLEVDIPETPKPNDTNFSHHHISLYDSSSSLTERIQNELTSLGLNVWVDEEAYDEDVNSLVKRICSKAISVLSKKEPVKKPAALIFHGESSIKVIGNGKGGRNQHLSLACAIALEGQHSVTMISIGTDGVDGDTDAAGALITSKTTLQARKKKINPEEYLQNFDSYHFHEEMDTLIKTGATGNNLMDLQVLIIE